MFTQPHRMTFKGKHFSVPTLEAIDLGYKLPEGVDEDIALWKKHYARFIDDTYLFLKDIISLYCETQTNLHLVLLLFVIIISLPSLL